MRRKMLIAAVWLMGLTALPLLLLGPRQKVAAATATAAPSSAACVRSHAAEAAGYARIGMAHAFSQPAARDAQTGNEPFFHAVSGTYYRQELRTASWCSAGGSAGSMGPRSMWKRCRSTT